MKKTKEGSDIEIIKKTTEELSKSLQSIGEAMHKSAQSRGLEGQGGQQNPTGQAEQPGFAKASPKKKAGKAKLEKPILKRKK